MDLMNICQNRNILFNILGMLLILGFLSIAIVSVSGASPIYVATNGSDSNTGTTMGTAKLSIKNATATVDNGGTVNIRNGTYTGANNKGINISKNIIYIGENQDKVIIDAAQSGRMFDINSGYTVTIKNITFINGKNTTTTSHGGAIFNRGNLIIENCIFKNNLITSTNSSYAGGGAISSWIGSTLSVTNCTFINNTANFGGAISNLANNLKIVNCTFINNTATKEEGGGAIVTSTNNTSISGNLIFVNNSAAMGSGGAIEVTSANPNGIPFYIIKNFSLSGNVSFVNNSANVAGGAIFNCGNNSMITGNITFANNSAIQGGAIHNVDGANFSLSGSSFNRNNANYGVVLNSGANFSLTNSSFSGNNASEGVIYNIGVNFSVRNSSFSGNNANFGGVILNSGVNFSVGNSSFSGNNASVSAGVIYNNGVNFSVGNSSFSGNNANFGGAIYNAGVNFSVGNSSFSGNNANFGGVIYINGGNFSVGNSSFSGNNASNGSAIFSFNSKLTIINCNFTGNNAINGGAIYNNATNCSVSNSSFVGNTGNNGSAIYNNATSFSVSNSSFAGNNATNYGGAIFNDWTGNFSVINSSFMDNNASSGGAITNYGGVNCSVSNSSFSGNNASSGGAIFNFASYSSHGVNFCVFNSSFVGNNANYGGAAIHNINGLNFSVINSSFVGNNATNFGGAIYSSNSNGGNFSVINSSFMDNNASSGGAIYNIVGTNFRVINSNFTGNSARDGGVIYNLGGTNFSVINSSFVVNNATNYGGAICNTGTNFSVINSNFTGNNASVYGGVIFNYGDNFSVINSDFADNNANGGGAIYNSNSNGTNFSVINSSFIGNNATNRGGVIFNNGVNFSVINSSFIGNNATSNGGVIYNSGANFVVSNGSSFINNSATDNGGAIYNSGANFVVSNGSSFINNSAIKSSGVSGGAIYNSGSNFNVINSSFTSNTANSGGAICNSGANAVNFIMINSTFSGNNARHGGAIYNTGVNLTMNTSKFFNNSHIAIYTLNNQTSINNNSFDGNDGVLGIGFNNSTINLNTYLISNNIITNNDIILLVDGHRNNISSGSIIGNNNSRGIFVNGHNNTFSNITIANLKVGFTFNTTNSGNIISNATFYGNEVGILMLGSNDTVMSSTIINNTIVGINITGNNNIVQYNRIYNNTLGLNNSGTNINTNFNWWGLNDITGQYANSSANFNLTYWYVLELSLNNTYYTTQNATRNYSKNQSADLTYNLSLNIPVTNNPSLLPYFEVTVLVKNSTDIVNSSTGDIRNTSLSKTVVINNPNTQYSINALSDSENLILTIIGEDINYTVNVSLVKVANKSVDIHVGDNITYTITVTNHGTLNNATEVYVEDTIDYNKVNFLNSTVTKGNYTYGTGIWDIGVLEPGETVTLEVFVTIIGTGIIKNTVIVDSDENNTNNNTTSSVILNITDVDVGIVKIANATGTQYIGDNITYAITVNNSGESNATGVYVIDNLDYTKLQFNSANPSTGIYNHTTGIWTIGELTEGQTATLTINVTIINNGTIKNTANITTDQRNIAINGSNYTFTAFSGLDVYVNATGGLDTNTGVNWTNALQSIERAFEIVQNGGTIHIAGNNYNNTNGIPKNNTNLTISKNVTLLGYRVLSGEVIIDALNNGRIFIINNGLNVSLINLTFANANIKLIDNNRDGSAIYNNGSMIIIKGSSFINNTASSGGAIYNNKGNNFTITENTSFINNTASLGGAIYNNNGTNFTVTNSTFVDNNASSWGGAIFNYYNGANFSVSNSTFIGNNASLGGAISNGVGAQMGADNFSVSNSSFINNTASTYGGAISNSGHYVSVSNSTFIGNTASNYASNYGSYGGGISNSGYYVSVSNSTFIGNTASSYGGGIDNMGSYVSVNDSTFIGNTASNYSSYGGGISNRGSYVGVSNSTFIGNNAIFGGAIFNIYDGNFNVGNGSSFVNNSASNGGAIYNAADNLTVSDSVFLSNKYIAIYTVNNLTFINNDSFDGNGGVLGIGFNDSTIDLNSYLLSNNTIINNDIVLLVDGHRNNISSGSIIGNNNTRGIFVNGNNNTFSNIKIANLKVGITFNSINDNNTFTNHNNIFTNGTLSGNDLGAIMNGLNGTIISTTIVNNTITGVNITGSNNTVNYNRIYQNTLGMINSGNNTNANFNWWGKNNITGSYTDSGLNLSLSYWYVLQLSLNSTFNTTENTTRNYTKNIPAVLSYTLTLNNLNTNITNTPNLLPYFAVKVLLRNSTNTVNSSTGDIRTLTFAQVVMLSNNDSQASINALADDEDIVLILDNGTKVNLTIVKIANVTYVSNNGTINFTITIINNGGDFASNVTFIDLLNNGFKLLNTTGGSYNSTTGLWTIGDIGPGVTVTLNMIVQAIKSGIINNTAGNLTAIETLVNPNINSTVTINVTPAVNLNITKVSNVVGFDTAHVGDHVKYTITVKNNGLDTGTNVQVYDILDSKLIYFNYTSSVGSYDNNTGLWNIGTLHANQTATLEIEVIIASSGTIENIANVTANEVILNGSNTNTSTTFYVEEVNVSIIKVSNASANSHYGDHVKYIITVENYGPINATNVTVTDYLDKTKLIYIDHTAPDYTTYDSITGLWNIGNLEAGLAVLLTIEVEVIGFGNITNTANITTAETNINNQTNSTAEFNVSDVNVTIVKVSNTSGHNHVGDNITYTITVRNNGSTNASNVTVVDLLDSAKLHYLNSNVTIGSYNPTTGIWNIGKLKANTTATLLINVTLIAEGNIFNKANLTTAEVNINNKTNVSTEIVVGDVNVSIIKVSNITSGIGHYGNKVTYIITVTNNGLLDATGVTVNETLDNTKLKFTGYITSDGSIYDNNTGIWTIGLLNHNTTVTLILNATIINIGTITNTANLTTEQNNTNNQTNISVIINVSDVNITIIKVSNLTENPHVGDNISYIITVTNNGTTNASNVTVTDNLDHTKLHYINASATIGNYDEITGQWIIKNLTSNTTATLTINVTIIGIGTITNTANITAAESNINSQNNSTVEFTVNDLNLTILKVSNATENPYIGDYIEYKITIINNGKSNATNFNITELLDQKLKLINYTANIGTYNPISGKWQIANLNNNTIAILTIQAQIIDIGTIINTAALEINENNLGNNNSTVIINVNNNSNNVNLTINKIANQTKAKSGEYITYTITVINQGANTATGVKVNEILDPRLKYISSSGYGSYDLNTGIWNINTLKAGETAKLIIKVQVKSSGSITNIVNITSNENNINPKNSSSITINVTPVVDIEIKIVPDKNIVKEGEILSYHIVLVNHGPDNATGVKIKLNIPDEFKHASFNSEYGSYDPSTGIWTIGNLNAGETSTAEFKAIATKEGIHEISASVESNEFDIDNSTTKHSVNIKVDPTDNPQSLSPQPNPQYVNGKVAMKKTGIPILMVIIIISLFTYASVWRKR
ncbi:DUF11 domain-containing protein [Methanobrevibacter filiformis]|uniref:Putative outer membrane protein pmp6 n=1 Tax=Methanobrevibacter filiformis TaxID=55758 RepID=A0A166DBX3_9EURY|nr:DUF11 domain-containing protein [Methanobrevibacter filiformis]KZX15426.1 putative outer membrane protein pmp6 precursor [Methanobrevibacter filiformis]